ncbi:MAG: hypothetical protein HXO80_03290 [Selenomonas sp.]|nr:hypothetical protein [Selenomonas sp.]
MPMLEVSKSTIESIAEIKRLIAVLDDEPLTDSDIVDIAILDYLCEIQHMMQHLRDDIKL